MTHQTLKPSLPTARPTTAMNVAAVPPERQQELISKIKKTSMEWVSQVGQMQRFEVEFATRLASCTKPSEAVALCSDWMTHRVDSAVGMQHRLLELWLDAVTAGLRDNTEAKLAQSNSTSDIP